MACQAVGAGYKEVTIVGIDVEASPSPPTSTPRWAPLASKSRPRVSGAARLVQVAGMVPKPAKDANLFIFPFLSGVQGFSASLRQPQQAVPTGDFEWPSSPSPAQPSWTQPRCYSHTSSHRPHTRGIWVAQSLCHPEPAPKIINHHHPTALLLQLREAEMGNLLDVFNIL